jgi:hypothetical protein
MRFCLVYSLTISFFLFAFTSCIEVVEETTISVDGTGTFALTINASASREQLDKIKGQDSFMGKPVPTVEKVQEEIRTLRNVIASTPGISNILVKEDYTQYIARISFQFDKVASLDQVFQRLYLHYQKEQAKQIFVERKGNTYARFYSTAALKNQLNKVEEFKSNAQWLTEVSITSIVRCPSLIKHQLNPAVIISPSGKAAMLKTNLHDLLNERQTLSNTITY